MLLKGIVLILIGSLIGWITNYIAIKMLFRPYKEINIFFFKIQGLIPKRRAEIAVSLAETIQTELLSVSDIAKKLKDAKLENQLEEIIDKILAEKLEKEIKSKFPMAAMFLNDVILKQISDIIKKSIIENKDMIMAVILETIEKNVDFKEIITEKINSFSLEKLEEIVFALAKKELKHIEIIGAILGALIGMVQFIITIVL